MRTLLFVALGAFIVDSKEGRDNDPRVRAVRYILCLNLRGSRPPPVRSA